MSEHNPFDDDRPLSARQATIWLPIIAAVAMILGWMILGSLSGSGGDRMVRTAGRAFILLVGGGLIGRWWMLRVKEKRETK